MRIKWKRGEERERKREREREKEAYEGDVERCTKRRMEGGKKEEAWDKTGRRRRGRSRGWTTGRLGACARVARGRETEYPLPWPPSSVRLSASSLSYLVDRERLPRPSLVLSPPTTRLLLLLLDTLAPLLLLLLLCPRLLLPLMLLRSILFFFLLVSLFILRCVLCCSSFFLLLLVEILWSNSALFLFSSDSSESKDSHSSYYIFLFFVTFSDSSLNSAQFCSHLTLRSVVRRISFSSSNFHLFVILISQDCRFSSAQNQSRSREEDLLHMFVTFSHFPPQL